MGKLSQKIIELRLATRRACMCEDGGSTKKNTLSLKTKVLFLIEKGCSAREIIASLVIAKTNLALITTELCREGLITKSKGLVDRREVNFTLTEDGYRYLAEREKSIEDEIGFYFGSEDEYDHAIEVIAKAIAVLDGNNEEL